MFGIPKRPEVNDTWEYVDPKSGSKGRVILASREKVAGHIFEVWRWYFCYADGSGSQLDWTPSKRKAVEECSTCFGHKCRFTKVKALNGLTSENMETIHANHRSDSKDSGRAGIQPR